MLNGESKVPDWGPCHHHGGCNAFYPSKVNVEINTQTKTEGFNKESSKADANQQQYPRKFYTEHARKKTASNIGAPEYLKGLSSTIASVMEGLGNSFIFYIRPLVEIDFVFIQVLDQLKRIASMKEPKSWKKSKKMLSKLSQANPKL